MSTARIPRTDGGREVVFETWNPQLPSDIRKPEVRDRPARGNGRLYRPEGDPKLPRTAVVIAQGLEGPIEPREYAYARWLAERGFVAMVPRTFGARALGKSDHTWRALRVTTAMMTADAFGALRFLRAQPGVDPDRVAIMGFSYGGMVSVLTAYEQMRRDYLGTEPGFAGHVSYYGCSIPRMDDPTATGAPVMILLGEKDRNVSVPRSRQIADDLRRGGAEVDLRVFEGIYHQWDSGQSKPELFSLRRCAIRVDREGRLFDETSGRKLQGWFSRLLYLTTNVSLRGYRIEADAATTETSNALLLGFLRSLGRRGEEPEAPAKAG
jgi:dienelactone hydrolase